MKICNLEDFKYQSLFCGVVDLLKCFFLLLGKQTNIYCYFSSEPKVKLRLGQLRAAFCLFCMIPSYA